MEILTAPPGYQPSADLLQGRTVLVTGAGDGIGRAAALSYAGHGATVILLGRTGSKLEAVYDEIEAVGGQKPALVELDLAEATEEQCSHLADGLAGEFPHLDGLLHNASLDGVRRPIESAGYGRWLAVMQVDVAGGVVLARRRGPLLRGARLLLLVERGEDLFTSPEWRAQRAGARPEGRAFRGPTRWPVVVVHFPRSLDCRADAIHSDRTAASSTSAAR